MTPKEKAIELYEAMFYKIEDENTAHNSAKQCALIAVDEIIASQPTEPSAGYYETMSDRVEDGIYYWQQVKEEINKI